MRGAYYNEIDPIAAEWLRRLIAAGHIAPGEVDERSIVDVRPADLRGYRQCHFFAGIGVWSYALRSAGWKDEREVWTGSCPCQPFSDAGAGEGFDDERHLFPAWSALIGECRPRTIFGEQVASKDGLAWLDLVHADLEAAGYTVGAVDLCAAGVGAPHIRQRLFFVGDAQRDGGGRHPGAIPRAEEEARRSVRRIADGVEPAGAARELADDGSIGRERRPHAEGPAREEEAEWREGLSDAERSGDAGRLADTNVRADERGLSQPGERAIPSGNGEVRPGGLGDPSSRGRGERGDAAQPRRGRHADGAEQPGRVAHADGGNTGAEGLQRSGEHGQQQEDRRAGGWRLVDADGGRREDEDALAARRQPDGVGPGPTNGFWREAVWIPCRDGKARPIEPGTFPLAHGAPARVGRLRAYGNAINAEAAREFICAYLDVKRAQFVDQVIEVAA